jgi:hypothetical protein
MENLQDDHDQFKAGSEPEWIVVHGRHVVHRLPFRMPEEVNPWAFVMHHAFLGWRAIRHAGDLLLVPDSNHWGMA